MALLHTSLMFKNNFSSEYLGEEMINLLDTTFVIPEYYNYNIFEVTEEYVARPDLISYDAYGDEMYTDVICKLNGISNPFELNKGTKLIIPSPEHIMNFITKPSANDIESDEKLNRPIAKQKNEKRKPNEAIVGDKRFKIDRTSGVIIY
jgi:hypothetical protein